MANLGHELFVIRQVRGQSMAPALRPGQLIVGVRRYGELRPGEIVVVQHRGLEKIKRIQKIENERLFVVGDNASQSTDSRDFGWLPQTAVVAKVFWPRAGKYV